MVTTAARGLRPYTLELLLDTSEDGTGEYWIAMLLADGHDGVVHAVGGPLSPRMVERLHRDPARWAEYRRPGADVHWFQRRLGMYVRETLRSGYTAA